MVSVRQTSSKPTPEAIEGEIIADSPPPAITWLRFSSQTPLLVVPCMNYLRYGPEGVRRFAPSASPPPPPLGDKRELNLQLRFKSAGGELRWEPAPIPLKLAAVDFEGPNRWQGSLVEAKVVIRWNWDFYRLHSQLEVWLALDQTPSPAYTAALAALQSLKAGDQAVAFVAGRAGDILQVYPVDAPPDISH